TQLQPAVVLDSSGALDRPHSFPTRRSSDLSPGRNKGMNPQEYDRMRQLEDWYWWFVARREAALRFTEDFRPRREPLRILDAGCGTGALLDLLQKRPGAEVYGLDYSGQALAYTRERGHRHLVQADLTRLPFPDGT